MGASLLGPAGAFVRVRVRVSVGLAEARLEAVDVMEVEVEVEAEAEMEAVAVARPAPWAPWAQQHPVAMSLHLRLHHGHRFQLRLRQP